MFGGQAESWTALIELAPELGENWLLVGGQMVFPHETERGGLGEASTFSRRSTTSLPMPVDSGGTRPSDL